MATIKEKAYIPSVGDFDALKEKFPAFASAMLSDKAREQGAGHKKARYKDQGFYYLRTPFAGSNDGIHFGYLFGVRSLIGTIEEEAGLRIVLPLIYDPNSNIVRTCRNLTRTSLVLNEDKKVREYITSTAPIVKYAQNDYIWLNRDSCERGKARVMKLISLDIIEKAVQFAVQGEHNDYAKAEDLRKQCQRVAFENATEEELKLVVEAIMSSEDGYERVKYKIPHKEDAVENENESV